MKLFRLLTIILLITGSISASSKKLNVIVITGGHDFDRESFFKMFDSFEGISYTELKHPDANLQLGKIDPKTFDAVVFYDMPKTISEAEKGSYYKLLKQGKGLLFRINNYQLIVPRISLKRASKFITRSGLGE